MPENVNKTKIMNIIDQKFSSPVIVGGFIGNTSLGVTTTSYIIQEFNLHEVAMIKSSSIPPVTVFVGGKMRSPFRIYSNKAGTLVIIQCEVPIDMSGLYDVTETLMEWVKTIKPKEFVVIDGVPVRDLPEERKAFLVASRERINELKSTKIETAEAALITGVGGAILNESIFSKEKTIALITHVSTQFPDPNAVLAIVNALNSIYNLKIETSLLEKSVKEIQQDIERVTDEYKHLKGNGDEGEDPNSMYR